MKLTLNFEEKDFYETSYFTCEDCAITRALKRSGYNNYIDTGTEIVDEVNNGTIIVNNRNKQYKEMTNKVVRMYAYTDDKVNRTIESRISNTVKKTKPKNFTCVIEIDEQ